MYVCGVGGGAYAYSTKTATRYPNDVKYFPKVSIKVLFPAPGGPDRPIRYVGKRCCDTNKLATISDPTLCKEGF